jgi:hypothetical protein
MIAEVVAVGRTTRRVMTTIAIGDGAGGGARHLYRSCHTEWNRRGGHDLPASKFIQSSRSDSSATVGARFRHLTTSIRSMAGSKPCEIA